MFIHVCIVVFIGIIHLYISFLGMQTQVLWSIALGSLYLVGKGHGMNQARFGMAIHLIMAYEWIDDDRACLIHFGVTNSSF